MPRLTSRSTWCAPKRAPTSSSEISGWEAGFGRCRIRRGISFMGSLLDSIRQAVSGKCLLHQPLVHRIEEHRQEEVEHEDGHEREDKRLRCRLADALRPGLAVEAAMTTHQRDHRPE